MSKSKPKPRLFAESPTQRLRRLIENEKKKLERAERELLNGSMTFSLQQVHQGKDAILSIKREIRRLESVLEKGTHADET